VIADLAEGVIHLLMSESGAAAALASPPSQQCQPGMTLILRTFLSVRAHR
jgi:hypothetical protein